MFRRIFSVSSQWQYRTLSVFLNAYHLPLRHRLYQPLSDVIWRPLLSSVCSCRCLSLSWYSCLLNSFRRMTSCQSLRVELLLSPLATDESLSAN